MDFGDKLDLLMNICTVSNSDLARIVGLDASFVSRLRRGERPPSSRQSYIRPMADYFARTSTGDLQRMALCEIMNLTAASYPQDAGRISDLIHSWLLETKREGANVEDFLNHMTSLPVKSCSHSPGLLIDLGPDAFSRSTDTPDAKVEVYYGLEGKQKALMSFLKLAVLSGKPRTLLIHSSEGIEWLMHDREFKPQWTALLMKAIGMGYRFRIIHTVKRNREDMLASIREWIPIYMTGAFEPFYDPGRQYGIFGRTLMIAPDVAAFSSSSIGEGIRNAANFVYRDQKVIEAFRHEFDDYLRICRPLMRVFTESSMTGYADMFVEFDSAEVDGIIKTDTLSSISMPMETAASLSENRSFAERTELLFYHQSRIRSIEKRLRRCTLSEIITLPDTALLNSGKLETTFCDTPSPAYYSNAYTPESYRAHLLNIIRMLENYANYHVYLSETPLFPGSVIYAKEHTGVLIKRTSRPSMIFGISEASLADSFMEYMESAASSLALGKSAGHKKKIIATLRRYVESIEI